jgi:NAD(P)-dependent dehydrogenase (short-subunit alcohol dehydrogenase family)
MSTATSFSLAGKTAVVTGASSGLGAHFAGVLARAGARVALGARRTERIEALAEALRAAGHEAAAFALDVTEPESVAAFFREAEAALGPVDVLVNNAGIAKNVYFTDLAEADWQDLMAVNLDGVFRVAQAAARSMKARGQGGAIVNVASILGMSVIKTLSSYCASKGAVIQLTKAMALELARDKIRVNALAPGYIETEMNAAFFATKAGERLLQRVGFERLGRLEELDGPLLLLSSDAGSFMTGTVVPVDGGLLLAMG